MKKLQQDDPSTADLILIWKGQAFEVAVRAKTPDPVARFLEARHIPKHEASVAAIMIWNEAKKSRIKESLPALIFGSAILGAGLLYAGLMLLQGSLFFFVGLGPIAFGGWIIWDGYPRR